MELDGELHLARLTVVERADHRTNLDEFRLYNLSTKQNKGLVRSGAAFAPSGAGASLTNKPTVSIDSLVAAVKEYDPTHAPSVVVNPDGTPKRVFFGSRDASESTIAESQSIGGYVFSENADDAGKLSGAFRQKRPNESANVKPVYLAIRNPLVHDAQGQPLTAPALKAVVEQAKTDGHDGVILNNVRSVPWTTPGTSYVTFQQTQAKSATANTGDFDPDNPSIMFEGAVAEPERIVRKLVGKTTVNDFNRTFIARLEAANQADELAGKRGLTGEARRAFIDDQVANRRSESWQAADAYANRMALQEDGGPTRQHSTTRRRTR